MGPDLIGSREPESLDKFGQQEGKEQEMMEAKMEGGKRERRLRMRERQG